MSPVLTIAIPTYNRVRDLATCLESVRAGWQPGFEGRVELLVSSNGSEDGTDELVAGWHLAGLPLRYHRWPENVGALLNIMNLFTICKGAFCWLLSDDDALEPQAIANALQFLDNHPDAGGLLLGSNGWDSEMTAPLPNSAAPSDQPAVLLDNFPELWRHCIHGWGLLSVCIINVARWKECIGRIPMDLAGAYPHVWFQAEIARKTGSWGFNPVPLVRWRMDRDHLLRDMGIVKRGMTGVDSYGNLAIFYDKKDPLLARFARDLCCGVTRHYLQQVKAAADPAPLFNPKGSFTLIRACAGYKGWLSRYFYTDVIPFFLLPTPLFQGIKRRRQVHALR
jgi:glycosyltransferase involved in cell wall biosynthesis